MTGRKPITWLAQVYSGDVLSKIILASMGVVLIRGMKLEDYARYTITFAAISLVVQVLSSSVNRIYILSEHEANLTVFRDEEETAAGFWAAQMCVVGVLAAILATVWASQPVFWLAVWTVLASCSVEFAKAYHQRKLSFARFAYLELARSGFCFAGIALVFASQGSISLAEVLSVQAAALTIVFSAGVYHARSYWKRIAWRRTIRLLRSVAQGSQRWLLAHALCITILLQSDVALLQWWCDDLQVATFGAAMRFAAILSLALNAVHTVLLPSAVSLREEVARRTLLQRHRRTLPLFALIVASGTIAMHAIMPRIDQGRYPDAVFVLDVLAVGAVISFALSPYFHVLAAHKDYRFLAVAAFAGIAVDIAMNSLLVPSNGAIGAAFSMVVATSFVNGAMFFRALFATEMPKLRRIAA
jgi:O-antigen/teichoic acid export membrane protein